MSDSADSNSQREEKQCRICLDGSEAEHAMGKLIRPCLCKGSISVRFFHMDTRKPFLNLTFGCKVCPCEMSSEMEKYLFV